MIMKLIFLERAMHFRLPGNLLHGHMTKRKNFRDTSKKVFHENWQKSLYFKNVDFGLTHGGSRNLMENANFSTSFKVRYIFYFLSKEHVK